MYVCQFWWYVHMVVHLEPDDLVGKISCRCEVFKLSKLQSLPRNKMLICHIIYVVSLCVSVIAQLSFSATAQNLFIKNFCLLNNRMILLLFLFVFLLRNVLCPSVCPSAVNQYLFPLCIIFSLQKQKKSRGSDKKNRRVRLQFNNRYHH